MPSHLEELKSPFNTSRLFALVADIEKYPEFLPWCSGARILSRTDNIILAELMIRFKIFSDRYTSRVELIYPEEENSPAKINVTLVKGPFEHLENKWEFLPSPEGGSLIKFFIDFEFSNIILKKLITPIFEQSTSKMIIAFEQRAEKVYNG